MQVQTTTGRGRMGKGKSINVGRTERNASLIGGAALALSGLSKLKHHKVVPGLAMVAAGSMFLYRGKTGHCDMYQAMGINTATGEGAGVQLEKVVTINRTPDEVYRFWRNLENLPRFMHHLDAVSVTGATTSHWRAKGPAGVTVEWDAEIREDQPGKRISWQSMEQADVPNEGTVEFQPAPGGRGTEVRVNIVYYPPGGAAGVAAAKIANSLNAQQIEEDLKRLKQILETGETVTSEMQWGQRPV